MLLSLDSPSDRRHKLLSRFVLCCVANLPLLLHTCRLCAAEDVTAATAASIDGEHNGYGEPHFAAPAQRNVIVQLHDWRFVDVAEECRRFLGPAGYAGVQISPVTEHLLFESESAESKGQPWLARYLPVSYAIASDLGGAEDLRALSDACNAAGVRVYVVVVLNHMAANETADAASLAYPAVPYTAADFHAPCERDSAGQARAAAGAPQAYADGHELRNCRLASGAADLDQSRPHVRERVVALLNELVDVGVAGFRVHAAEHMWPTDLKAIFDGVKDLNSVDYDFAPGARPLFYMDVDDVRYGQWMSKTEYTPYGLVTDYWYAQQLHEIIWQRELSALINCGPAMGFVQHQFAAVFVDDVQLQRGSQPGTTYRQRRRYVLANAFMLAHPYGRIKLLMSSYAHERRAADRGAPATAPDYDEAAQCTAETGWICEHRWTPLVGMVALANNLSDEQDGMINFQTNGPHQIAFCRGNSAFVAFNKDPLMEYAAEVHTCLAAGVYCDVISGGVAAGGADCNGKRVVVDAEGLAQIAVPALSDEVFSVRDMDDDDEYSVLAIYEGSKLPDDGSPGAQDWELVGSAELDPSVEEGDEGGGDGEEAEGAEGEEEGGGVEGAVEADVDSEDGGGVVDKEEEEATEAAGEAGADEGDADDPPDEGAEEGVEPQEDKEATAEEAASEERQVVGDIEPEADDTRRK